MAERLTRLAVGLTALALALSGGFAAGAPQGETPKDATARPPAVVAYPARALPDRIVLTPGADPAHQMAVAFRTDKAQATAEAQLAPGLDGPSLEARAQLVTGTTLTVATGAGEALYHHVTFTGLSPDKAYVYRVKGAAGWSEWFQFRTAAEGFKPFRFFYFGDTQNNILSIGSRVIRQAFYTAAHPALVVHAGDLVDQSNDIVADNNWGQWTAAGGYNFAMVPQLPAAGNHEFLELKRPDGTEPPPQLGPLWGASFALPGNGTDPVKSSTYYVDYQGVRFIVLDGTAATEGGALKPQTEWLARVLSESKARWTVVVYHQPMFMCSRPTDLTELQTSWKPLFEKHGVDLVLQGHDHCYSRISDPAGKSAAKGPKELHGPVYMISVTGSKMYALSPRAMTQPDRVAEDTEIFNVIDVEEGKLRLRAYGATGQLYDSFEIVRGADGKKSLVEAEGLPPLRVCKDKMGPDGLPCTARAK